MLAMKNSIKKKMATADNLTYKSTLKKNNFRPCIFQKQNINFVFEKKKTKNENRKSKILQYFIGL